MKTQRAATKAVTVKKRNNNKHKNAAYKVDKFEVPENPTLEDIKHAVGLQELEERVRDAKESAWETDSLLEDAIAEMGDAKLSSDGRSISVIHSLTHTLPMQASMTTPCCLCFGDYVFLLLLTHPRSLLLPDC